MRLALAGVVLATSLAHAESVKLGAKPRAAGEKWTDEVTLSITATVEAEPGKTAPFKLDRTEKKRVEVLEAKPEFPTKARITYEKATTATSIAGKGDRAILPVEGKTYTVTAGEPLAVEPATDAELVRDIESRFGKPDGFRTALAGKELVRGKPIDLTSAAPADLLGADAKVTKLTVDFAGMDGANAKFAVQVNAVSRSDGAMVMALTGTLLVEQATALPLDFALAGTIKSGKKLDGTIAIHAHRTR